MSKAPVSTVAMPWFQCRDGIYEIDDFDLTEVFVVVGEERALVIDTGAAMGDFRWLIENKITDKPYDVVCTHSHGDHIGGACLFDKIYIHENDLEEVQNIKELGDEFTKGYFRLIQQREGKFYPYDIDGDCLPWTGKTEFIPIKDGHVFDLGGRTVTVYHTPGHTPGEIVLIDSKTKTLLAGDAINENYFMNFSIAPTPMECLQLAYGGLERLLSMAGDKFELNNIYNFHHDYRGFGNPLNPDTLPNLAKGLKSMIDHNAHYEEVPDPMSDCGGTRTVVKTGKVEIATFGMDIRSI